MIRVLRIAWRGFEDTVNVAAMALLALIPFAEIVLRKLFRTGIPGSAGYLANIVVVLSFFAAMATSREGKHLSIASDTLLKGGAQKLVRLVDGIVSATVSTALFWSSFSLFFGGFDAAQKIGFVPVRVFVSVIPLGFLVMAVRFLTVAPGLGKLRLAILPGFLIGSFAAIPSIVSGWAAAFGGIEPAVFAPLIEAWQWAQGTLSLPALAVLVLAACTGTPVFVFLGGLAYVFFSRSGGSLEVIPSEAYTLLTGSSIAAIPLFTMAGYILSESRAGERLVELFRAALGWLPGGIAVAAVIVSTFFTTFTGATGITIVALGALLALVLKESGGYTESFSQGLVTGTASIGLLFLPSLPLIIYATTAQISVVDMFLGGIIPGSLLVLSMCALGIVVAVRNKVPTVPFEFGRLVSAIRVSFWEILIPVIIVVGYFSGLMTLTETAAITPLYCALVEVFIKKDMRLRDLAKVLLKSAPVIGGVLVILACARGLAYYAIDAEIPVTIAAWVQGFIHSKILFLALLNLFLLVVGCFMDIFSAILVVAPLIIPIGSAFGIQPVHLGIIFIANLGLGHMNPPVGFNLFLASYVFKKPLGRVYRDVLPFVLVQLAVVLLITYVPLFTTIFLKG
jgi:C4-dicarboxylate transporter, DctM subunit